MLFDVVNRIRNVIAPSPEDVDALCASIQSILKGGIGLCLEATSDGTLPINILRVAVDIIAIIIPYANESPTQSASFLASTDKQSMQSDEFDDDGMMDVWATMDLDGMTTPSLTPPRWSMNAVKPFAINVVLKQLRLSVQKLVLAFPPTRFPGYHELYLIDLLGSMIATGSFPFRWSVVTSHAQKSRMLPARLLAAIFKHSHDVADGKKWFSTCFLSEREADVELAQLWLMATLDIKSLFPTVCGWTQGQTVHDIDEREHVDAIESSFKISDYWLMLTDGLLACFLQGDPVVRFKLDATMFQLFHATAVGCGFAQGLDRLRAQDNDLISLYDTHVKVFRVFCMNVGKIWNTNSQDSSDARQSMTRYRVKMMDLHRGVFVALLE
jgi:hypothetical protein